MQDQETKESSKVSSGATTHGPELDKDLKRASISPHSFPLCFVHSSFLFTGIFYLSFFLIDWLRLQKLFVKYG